MTLTLCLTLTRRTATTMGPAAPGRLLPCQTTASAQWELPTGAASQVRAHRSTPTCCAHAWLSHLRFCGAGAQLRGRGGLAEAALSQPVPCSGWLICQREEPASASAPLQRSQFLAQQVRCVLRQLFQSTPSMPSTQPQIFWQMCIRTAQPKPGKHAMTCPLWCSTAGCI